MASVIDSLPEAQRKEVIDALLARASTRKVAKMVGISHTAVDNYRRKVIDPTLAAAQKLSAVNNLARNAQEQIQEVSTLTRAALAADPILQRIAAHRQTVDSKILDAQPAGAAALISADLRGLELEARLTGRLDSSPPATQINIVGPVTIDQRQIPADYSGEVIDLTPSR